jgi:hypothetical protein
MVGNLMRCGHCSANPAHIQYCMVLHCFHVEILRFSLSLSLSLSQQTHTCPRTRVKHANMHTYLHCTAHCKWLLLIWNEVLTYTQYEVTWSSLIGFMYSYPWCSWWCSAIGFNCWPSNKAFHASLQLSTIFDKWSCQTWGFESPWSWPWYIFFLVRAELQIIEFAYPAV